MQSSKFGELSKGRNGEDPRAAKCRSCDGVIWWVITRRGKNMPVNPDDTSHFETCPKADVHRGRGYDSQQPGSKPPAAAPAGPVWLGAVELDDEGDPEWFVVRVRAVPGETLKVGDLVKMMRRTG